MAEDYAGNIMIVEGDDLLAQCSVDNYCSPTIQFISNSSTSAIDVFEDYTILTWDWGYGDNWCFVCSRIDFDDKIKTDYVVLEGLFDYLKTNPVPLRPEETFFEYLYGESSEIIGDQLTEQDFGLNISTQTPLYIGFFADKRSDWEELGVSGVVTLTIAGVLGCAVGGVIGFFGGVAPHVCV